ncbi:hypothetical protein KFK14_23495 [Sphingobium phenoxybenzoativorans]|uniref:DUF4145 domain-containing protein n=1 Tax=Sphingobium phenoxybenzoativorans TaxID=1592790 RepID=A0A975Q1E1_9SPHN|nr:hypothetical protein [Sphingobium phenoxybenzoativorans]QUT05860.1 hypothetical protein KFK14_23495 [Sphingobium phenoxybenzoativorans]
MRRINLYDLVELGKALQSIAELRDETEPVRASINGDLVRESLEKIENGDLVEFGLLDENIKKVKISLDEIDARWRGKDKNGERFTELGWSIKYHAQEAIKSFEHVLAAECRMASTYFVSKVGIYSTNDLVSNASARFPKDMHTTIGEEALGQFQEAAQCLCFQLNTACGFHMMRAVEYVLLKYMKLICGRRFSSLNTNWGSYIAELKKIYRGNSRKKPQIGTIDLIRQIKNNHRNPVIHAEFILTAQEAQDIFQLGSVVISHLADAINNLKRENKTTTKRAESATE